MSDIVLLRTLTRKSIIGFGNFKDLTVQNLIDTRQQRKLLEIYYFCRNIDYMPDIKEELFILDDRVIDKKKYEEDRFNKIYYKNINFCYDKILENENEKFGKFQSIGNKMKRKKLNKAVQKSIEQALNRTIFSKGAQQRKNQW